MKLTLGFSPCPNDTFIFDALVNKKIDLHGLDFEVVLQDVQSLNSSALNAELDISKISYGVLPLVLPNYIVLNSGGALGRGVGPLLIAKTPFDISRISSKSIAVPGEHTTAHMLFSLAFPGAKRKVFKVFSDIEDAVLNDQVDAGVIIHENRFTYHQKGLHKLLDLGDFWERTASVPIPLGGIVARRSLGNQIIAKVDGLIKDSVDYAFRNNYAELSDYVTSHAQEMSEDVMRKHIDLYVNHYSMDLKEDGKKAVLLLLGQYHKLHADLEYSGSYEPTQIFSDSGRAHSSLLNAAL
ncbi:MAG: 1,4-dihydroxy-6-naphthoate synthase [Chitinophagaceae bacterium]|nr:1,4-dihydroxy-6-naphthoate synthase [Chitinophagaceae bacterium]